MIKRRRKKWKEVEYLLDAFAVSFRHLSCPGVYLTPVVSNVLHFFSHRACDKYASDVYRHLYSVLPVRYLECKKKKKKKLLSLETENIIIQSPRHNSESKSEALPGTF